MVDLPIGYVEIGIFTIAFDCERHGRTIDATLTLTDGAGDIHLEIEWVPLDSNPFRKRQLRNMSNVSSPLLKAVSRGQLFLRLLWAVGLPNVDYIGVSDPYCILHVSLAAIKLMSLVWSRFKVVKGSHQLCGTISIPNGTRNSGGKVSNIQIF